MRTEYLRANNQCDRALEVVVDYFAAAFVIMAVAFGRVVTWLLVR